MKTNWLILVLATLLLGFFGCKGTTTEEPLVSDSLITVWKTDLEPINPNRIRLPLDDNGDFDFAVD
ncbi:MAG: hypothetical protein MI892_23890, partial [Desulfobacterales bacterium]|nr:hypothetical protein [Desulfobacterales bacterium]